jgi:hypothetical protein
MLHAQGFRIWYDEGITPGNEWPDEIAGALAKATAFVVFISTNAIESVHVRNEINFALNRKKFFLAIYLEDTALPQGLELRMGDIQALLKWQLNESFYNKKLVRCLPSEMTCT